MNQDPEVGPDSLRPNVLNINTILALDIHRRDPRWLVRRP